MRKSYYFEVGNFANTGRFICETPEAVECVKQFTTEKVTKAHALHKLHVDSRILGAKDPKKALYHFEDTDWD